MTTELEDRLVAYRRVLDADIERAAARAELGTDLFDHRPVGLHESWEGPVWRWSARSWLILSASAAIVIAALVVLRPNPQRTDTPSTAPSEVTSLTPAVDPVPLFTNAPSVLRWQVIEPPARLARAMNPTLVAGPNGFVISAMGLEDGVNIGLVWRSTDGVTWEEADPELFHPRAVNVIGATRSWYFAAVNMDPASDTDAPFQLFRSKDGATWEPVGVPSTDSYQYEVLGDRLVRVGPIIDGGIDDQGIARVASTGTWQTSTDGQTWVTSNDAPFTFPGRSRPVSRGDTTYLVAWDLVSTRPIPLVAAATNDGYKILDNQPASVGYLTATPLGLVNTVGHWDECLPTTDVTSGHQALQPTARAGTCAWEQTISVQTDDDPAWRDLQTHGPATVGASQPISLGDQLVQLLVDVDRHLRIATSADGITWTTEPSIDIDTLSVEDRTSKTAASPDWPLLTEVNGTAVGLANREGSMVIVVGNVSA